MGGLVQLRTMRILRIGGWISACELYIGPEKVLALRIRAIIVVMRGNVEVRNQLPMLIH